MLGLSQLSSRAHPRTYVHTLALALFIMSTAHIRFITKGTYSLVTPLQPMNRDRLKL